MYFRMIRIILALLISFFWSNISHADWFSEYSSMITSNPSYYETQQQGYISFGGASYRVRTQTTPFVSLTMPRIQAGCGGIDMFWGGLSYMQPEYLVQAFQNIMSAAPAFAFDIALKVLCEQCYEVKSTLESMANLINQMAMDECGAARALVNMGGNYVANKLNEMGVTGTSSESSWLGNKLDTIQESINTAKGWLDDFYSTEFCPQGNPDLIGPCKNFINPAGGPKSFWQSLAAYADRKDASSTDPFNGCASSGGICPISKFFIALFGDIYIPRPTRDSDGHLKIIRFEYRKPAKKENEIPNIVAKLISPDETVVINGYFLPSGSSDYQADEIHPADLGFDFGIQSKEAISKIVSAILSGNASFIDEQTKKFINQQVFPLWRLVNIVAYQGDDAVMTLQNSVVQKYAAISNAYYFLNKAATTAMNYIEGNLNYLQEAVDYAPASKDSLARASKSLVNNITEFRRELTDHYRDILQRFYKSLDEITKMSMLEKEVTIKLRENYDYSPFMLK